MKARHCILLVFGGVGRRWAFRWGRGRASVTRQPSKWDVRLTRNVARLRFELPVTVFGDARWASATRSFLHKFPGARCDRWIPQAGLHTLVDSTSCRRRFPCWFRDGQPPPFSKRPQLSSGVASLPCYIPEHPTAGSILGISAST